MTWTYYVSMTKKVAFGLALLQISRLEDIFIYDINIIIMFTLFIQLKVK